MTTLADKLDRKKVASWALYDWANSAFATTVMAGFFPLFFKKFWGVNVENTVSTFWLGTANSLASIVIAVFAPVLGAIADCGGTKKKYLMFFAGMGIVMTGSLSLVAQGNWQAAIFLYIVAMIGFSGGNIFYDALIVNVSSEQKLERVSALGFSLGYLGGGLLFTVNVLMTLYPNRFGLADATQAVQVSFIMVAVWWAVFSIPLIVFVKEPGTKSKTSIRATVVGGFHQLRATFQEIRRLKVVSLFLLAYWFYIDGVHTIIKMAVDYGLALGFPQNSLITALLITQFVGFPCALLFGYLGERIGAKTGIFIGIGVYCGVTVWGYFMNEVWEFYALAVTIGMVIGGVQALSRSLYARIIPANKAGEFFGFYGILSKFAAVIGPILMGYTAVATGSSRLSLLILVVLFIIGAVLLSRVNEQEGIAMARELEKV